MKSIYLFALLFLSANLYAQSNFKLKVSWAKPAGR